MGLSEMEDVSEEVNEMKKCCSDCKTTKTPLWRVGPAGPKSLCNACGIRYRKKRRNIMGSSNKEMEQEQRTEKLDEERSGGTSGKCSNLDEDLRARLVALGKEVVVLQRQRSPMKRQRKMGEVEQAAILLMALSCGLVFG